MPSSCGHHPLAVARAAARSVNVLERPERIRRAAARTLDEEREAVNATRATTKEAPGKLVAQFQRALAVYGLITLRTDGENVVLAQKLEKRSGTREFDDHCLEARDGELVYNPDR